VCLVLRHGRSTALRVAFLLAQGGEFGFVLFGSAKALGVIDDLIFVMAVAIISLTMLLTPLLVKLGNWLAHARSDDAAEGTNACAIRARAESGARVVIGGYGRVGHTVGTILASSGISLHRLRHRRRTGRQMAQRGSSGVLW
jgi:glutathione-regulated potassium-efflux system ancillary protein KefC